MEARSRARAGPARARARRAREGGTRAREGLARAVRADARGRGRARGRVARVDAARMDARGGTDDDEGRAWRALADAFEGKFDAEMITVKEVMERRAEKGGRRMVLVDVRGEDERAVSVIDGAMSAEEYERARPTLGAHDAVCYCTIGYRSGQYAEKMSKARDGGEDVKYLNLYGSIVAYTHERGELIDPKTGAKTNKVHTFGKQWSCVADGYEPVFYKSALAGGLSQMVKGLFKRKK